MRQADGLEHHGMRAGLMEALRSTTKSGAPRPCNKFFLIWNSCIICEVPKYRIYLDWHAKAAKSSILADVQCRKTQVNTTEKPAKRISPYSRRSELAISGRIDQIKPWKALERTRYLACIAYFFKVDWGQPVSQGTPSNRRAPPGSFFNSYLTNLTKTTAS